MYVNGSLVAKTTQVGTISTPTNNTVMAIGCNPNGSSSSDGAFLTGKIYSLSIYDNVEWDVSEAGDNSIIAWNVRSNSNGAQKVYIASDGDIYANKDSSYLFANLGYAEI